MVSLKLYRLTAIAALGLAAFVAAQDDEETPIPSQTSGATPAESSSILADPQATAFLPGITTSYYGDLSDGSAPKAYGDNSTFNLTEQCESPIDLWLWDKGTNPASDDSGFLGFYGYFNECIALTNLTRDLDSGVDLDDGLENALANYNVTGAEDHPAMAKLVDQIETAGVALMKNMCEIGKCHIGDDVDPDVCTEKTLYIDKSKGNLLSYNGMNRCQAQICQKAKKMNTDDQDIGGIGVFISYGIQLVIAGLLFIVCIFDWIMCSLRKSFYLKRKSCFLQSKSFINLLINFHKAQIFFVISIMVAAYIKLHNKSDDVSTIDRFFLLLVAINGVTLLSFTLLTVYMIAGRSLYMLWTTLAGYFLCAALFLEVVITRTQAFAPYVYLLTFCEYWGKGDTSFIDAEQKKQEYIFEFMMTMAVYIKDSLCYAIIAFTMVVVIFLILHEFGVRARVPEKIKNVWRRYQRWLNLVVVILVLGTYAALIAFAVYLMQIFFHTIHRSTWGFGQIVAIFVWVPVLADYLHDRYVEWREHSSGKPCNHDRPMLPMHRTFSYEIEKGKKSPKPPKSPLPQVNTTYFGSNLSSSNVSELEGSSPDELSYVEYNEKLEEAGFANHGASIDGLGGLRPIGGLGGLSRPQSPEEQRNHAFGRMTGGQPTHALRSPGSQPAPKPGKWARTDSIR